MPGAFALTSGSIEHSVCCCEQSSGTFSVTHRHLPLLLLSFERSVGTAVLSCLQSRRRKHCYCLFVLSLMLFVPSLWCLLDTEVGLGCRICRVHGERDLTSGRVVVHRASCREALPALRHSESNGASLQVLLKMLMLLPESDRTVTVVMPRRCRYPNVSFKLCWSRRSILDCRFEV